GDRGASHWTTRSRVTGVMRGERASRAAPASSRPVTVASPTSGSTRATAPPTLATAAVTRLVEPAYSTRNSSASVQSGAWLLDATREKLGPRVGPAKRRASWVQEAASTASARIPAGDLSRVRGT